MYMTAEPGFIALLACMAMLEAALTGTAWAHEWVLFAEAMPCLMS